jgi:predicted DNA-binding protein (MmcQ/YjbR family)
VKAVNEKILNRFRDVCLALPEAVEVEAWGHPTFRAGKKMFAAIGQGEGKVSIGLNVGFGKQEELLKESRFYPTPYAAHRGWVSLNVTGKTDWSELAELVEHAYRQVANRRMLRALEQGDQ